MVLSGVRVAAAATVQASRRSNVGIVARISGAKVAVKYMASSGAQAIIGVNGTSMPVKKAAFEAVV